MFKKLAILGCKMVNGNCPECNFQVSREGPREGEVLECGDCGVELEILQVANGSIELEVAPNTEEDWGE